MITIKQGEWNCQYDGDFDIVKGHDIFMLLYFVWAVDGKEYDDDSTYIKMDMKPFTPQDIEDGFLAAIENYGPDGASHEQT